MTEETTRAGTRLAQLTAELEEERALREGAKAELADERQTLAFVRETCRMALEQRDAAQARARRWKAGAKHLYQLRQSDADGYWRDFHAANSRGERARADKATAEAAAMRGVLERARAFMSTFPLIPEIMDEINAALAGTAGRELAAHVQRLEASHAAIGELIAENGDDCDCGHHHDEHDDDCERCLACRISAALDAKGGA